MCCRPSWCCGSIPKSRRPLMTGGGTATRGEGSGGGEYHSTSPYGVSKLTQHGSPTDERIVSINPLLKPRLYWDVCLSILFFYNATVIPYYMAYGIGESISDPVFWINRVVDSCFFGTVNNLSSLTCSDRNTS
jgi:hypothetical protein